MRLKIIALIAISPFVISCTTNDTGSQYITEWESLVKSIESKEKLKDSQLKDIEKKHDKLTSQYSQITKNLSEEEILKIDSLQAQFEVAYNEKCEDDLINGIEGLINMVDGVKEGFSTTNDKQN